VVPTASTRFLVRNPRPLFAAGQMDFNAANEKRFHARFQIFVEPQTSLILPASNQFSSLMSVRGFRKSKKVPAREHKKCIQRQSKIFRRARRI
jgi:hypothetical protein